MCLIFTKSFNQWKTSFIYDNIRFDNKDITNYTSDREKFLGLNFFIIQKLTYFSNIRKVFNINYNYYNNDNEN